MYKLRQRKAAATLRALFYEETTGTNDLFNICLITRSKTTGKCALHGQPRSQAPSHLPRRESPGTGLLHSFNTFHARNSCKLKTDDV